MNVLFVSHTNVKYSAGRCLLNLIDSLLKKGVKSYVVIPYEGPIVEELKNRGVKYSILPLKTWATTEKNYIRRLLRDVFNLFISAVIAIKAYFWNIDIIYSNSSVICVGALVAFILKKPHIWHIREFSVEHYGAKFLLGEPLSIKLMGKLSSRVVVVSEVLKQKYSKYISSDKLKTIYDPACIINKITDNLQFNDKLTKQAITTLVISGLVHAGKGQMDAVSAVADLIRQGVQVKLKIIGLMSVPEYLKQLKQVISQNKIGKYIEFISFMDDPAPVYNSADIILVCSRWEGFGLVTIEGMLFRKPIIGARSGATPELIQEGFNGLLYEPGNYQELAEKIKYLIKHPKEAKQMGENGFREASVKYTMEKCTNEVYNILVEALKNKK